ncbi:FAD/NAD(P)-binding protein [Saccharothrix sp. HUAS TT1]|uniref:FAD/NAD(P)-binding protein n=1 Tax=unclassified Saccharothrix TaxID=2593673 RepID=UPI00345B5277
MNGSLAVCVVGMGPRGLSVLERLCANERARPRHEAVTVHVVDPAPPGPGSVWRTTQSRLLLMNTVASQITVHTDASTRIEGPIEPGPTLYEWARGLTRHEDPEVLAEAKALGPDSYPTRAFYGSYLAAAFDRVVATAPAGVTVRVHRSRAVAMADTHGASGGPQGVRLEDGTRVHDLDAVVLAQGHLPTRPSPREARTASLARIHGLTYLTPANPADVDLDVVPAGEPVLLRGLGLNFFDHMALLTLGRGGAFARDGDRLVYRPSGREPHLVATSRRGIPYHARGENQKGAHGRHTPRVFTADVVAELRRRAATDDRVSFGVDVWPRIAVEVESVYYGTLLRSRGRPADGDRLAERYAAARTATARSRLLDEHGVARADRWDWESISRPHGDRRFADRADFRDWLLGHLARDVEEARRGNVDGPLKAALDVLRDLRNEIRLVVDHCGLDGGSHRDDLDGWYTPLNAFLSIGPPARRVEEMIALVEAGVLELTGPGAVLWLDTGEDPAFVAESREVPGPPVRARVLIEARLPEPDLRRTEDPLMRHLLATEQIRAHRVPTSSGSHYETGGLSVTERPYHVLDAKGRAHPRRFAYGVPTESVHWVTAAGIRPGVDSVTLGDSDAIAQAVLSLTRASRAPFTVLPVGGLEPVPEGVIV